MQADEEERKRLNQILISSEEQSKLIIQKMSAAEGDSKEMK